MNPRSILTALLFAVIVFSNGCKEKEISQKLAAAPSFRNNIEDKTAAEMISKMESAMGGMDNWDNLDIVSWTFFSARHLVWDKKNGRVRIDSPRDTSIYLIDLNELTGSVLKGGIEVTSEDELKNLIKKAESIWINDSYWLFMPFKLRDPGVTVNYVREDTMVGGNAASVLQLTFENVGDTPENKYEIYIDKTDDLIKQWAYFKEVNQETPPRIWPWDNYKSFDGLKLSSDRSDKSGPSNVRIYKELDDKVFNSFEPFDYY